MQQPSMEHSSVPAHDEIGWGQRAFETGSILGAAALIAIQIERVATAQWSWSLVAALVCGAVFADFMSGLVHWFADTWFEETMPVLGRRLIRPFRVHHVNPADFLRRNFIDTNGDVSAVCILFLLSIYACPLETSIGRWWAAFLLASAITAWPTNQVHQWAHMPEPPRVIAFLHRAGILLSGEAHRKHHMPPYVEHYCIATGWLNRPLTAIQFFRRLESAVTWLTGLPPRQDDTRFIHGVRQQLRRERQPSA